MRGTMRLLRYYPLMLSIRAIEDSTQTEQFTDQKDTITDI